MAGEKFGGKSSYPPESMECQERFERLQEYIPFLRRMIERLEGAKDGSKESQLQKMRSLLNILTDSTQKLKLETIQRFEEVLRKLSRMEGNYEWSGGSPVAPQKSSDTDKFNADKDMRNYSDSPYSPMIDSPDSSAKDTDSPNVAQRKARKTAMDFFDETPRSPSPPSFGNNTADSGDSTMSSADGKDCNIPRSLNLPSECKKGLLEKPLVIPLERRDDTTKPIIIPLERKEQSNSSQTVLIPLERKDAFEAKWYEGESRYKESGRLKSNFGALKTSMPSDPGIVPHNINVHQTFISSESLAHQNVPRSDIPRLEEMDLNRGQPQNTGKNADIPYIDTSSSWKQDEHFQRRPPKDKPNSLFENRRTSTESTRSIESQHYLVPTTYDYGHGKNYPCPDAIENNKESRTESENDGSKMQLASGQFQRASLREKLALEINKVHRVGVSSGGALRSLSKVIQSSSPKRGDGSDSNRSIEENKTLLSPRERRLSGSFNQSETNSQLQKPSVDKNSFSFQSSKGYGSQEREQERSSSFSPPLFSSSEADSKPQRMEGSKGIENKKEGTVFEEFSFKKRKSISEQSSKPDKAPGESSEEDDIHSEKMSVCSDDSDSGSNIPFLNSINIPHPPEPPKFTSPPSSPTSKHYDHRLAPSHSVMPQPNSNSGFTLKPFNNPSHPNISNTPIVNQSDLVQQRSWSSHMVDDFRGYHQDFQQNIMQSHVSPTNINASAQIIQHNINHAHQIGQLNVNSPSQSPLMETSPGMQSQYMGMGIHPSQSKISQMHQSVRPQKPPLLPDPVAAFMPNQMSVGGHAWPSKNLGKGLLPYPQPHSRWQNESYSRNNSIPSLFEKRYSTSAQSDGRSYNVRDSWNRPRPEYSKAVNDPRLRRYDNSRPDQPEEKYRWKHPADPRRASPVVKENKVSVTENKQPIASITKEKEEVSSPLNSLYETEQAPKTGKGYGIQKFRIPKLKRDEPPKVPPKNVMGPMFPMKEASVTSKESTEAEEIPTDKEEENKEEEDVKPKTITKDLFETLLKMSLASEEGTRILENSKFITELREKLNLVRPKRTRPVIESDSESSEEEEVKPTAKGKKKSRLIIGSSDSDSSEEKEVKNDVTSGRKTPIIRTPLRRTPRSCRQKDQTPNVDSGTERPRIRSQRKLFEVEEVGKSSDGEKSDEEVESKDEDVNKEIESEVSEKKEEKNEVGIDEVNEEPKPKIPAKRTKRRSSLELLQEDIREMFICEGVLSANGVRMCRLLKEAASASNANEESSIEHDVSKDSEEFSDNLSTSSKIEDKGDQSEDSSEETSVKPIEKKVEKSKVLLQPRVVLRKTIVENVDSSGSKTERARRGNLKSGKKKIQDKTDSEIESIKEDSEESESQDVWKGKSKKGNETATSTTGSSEDVDSENLNVSKSSNSTVNEDKSVSFENESGNSGENVDSSKEKVEEIKDTESENLEKEGSEVLEGSENKNKDSSKDKNKENAEKSNKSTKFKKKLNRRWAMGIIKRAVNHKRKNSTSVSPSSVEGDTNVSENPAELLSNADLTDVDYFSNGYDAVRCKLCPYQGKQIVSHYITKHPKSEVLISRLSKDRVTLAWEWTEANKGALKNAKAALTSTGPFVCLMCESWHDVYAEFYDHVTTHTGEYRYKCKMCSYRSFRGTNVRSHSYYSHQLKWCDNSECYTIDPMEIDHDENLDEQETDEKPSMIIPGLVSHLCSKCNYVQISGKRLKDHVEMYHKEEENVKVLKIDMSVIAPESSEDHDVSKSVGENSDIELDEENTRSSMNNSLYSEKESTFSEVSKVSTVATGTEESIKKEDISLDDSQVNCAYDEEVFIINDDSENDFIKGFNKVWCSVLSSPELEKEIEWYQGEFKVKVEKDEEESITTHSTVINDLKEICKEEKDKEIPKKPAKEEDSRKDGVQNQDESQNSVIQESGENNVGGEMSDKVVKRVRGGTTVELEDSEDDSSYCECIACLDNFADDEVICDLIIEKPEKHKLFTLDILPELKVKTDLFEVINKVNDSIVNKFSLDESHVKTFEEEYEAEEKQAVEEKLASEEKQASEENEVSEVKKPQKIRVRCLSGDVLSSDLQSKENALASDNFLPSDQHISEAICNPEDGQDPYVDVTGNSPVFKADTDNTLCQISGVYSLHPNQRVPEDLINAVPDDVAPDMSNLAPYSPGHCSTPCPPPLYLVSPSKLISPEVIENTDFANAAVSVIQKNPSAVVSNVPSSQVNTSVISSLYPNAYSGESTTTGVIVEKTSNPTTIGYQKEPMKPTPIFPKPIVAVIPKNNSVNTSENDSTVLKPVNQSASAPKEQTNAPSRKDPCKDSVVGHNQVSNQTKTCSIMRASLYAKASKTPNVFYQVINNPMKLCHIYKCMGRMCSFTTDEAIVFLSHYLSHESLEPNATSSAGVSIADKSKDKQERRFDWQQCSYCAEMFSTGTAYVKHVQSEHGECIYQCAYCFYRAAAASYVMLHQNSTHINEKVNVLHCKRPGKGTDTKNDTSEVRPNVQPYVCYQGNCKWTFYCPDKYLLHLQTAHYAVSIYCCHKCNFQCFKPDRLIQHYKLHSFYLYQCVYCDQGSDTSEEILQHLASFHPNKKATVCKRNSQESSEGSARTTGRHAYILYEDIELTEKDDTDSTSKESLNSDDVPVSPAKSPENLDKESEQHDLQIESEPAIMEDTEHSDCDDDDNLVIVEDVDDTNPADNQHRDDEESDIIEILPDSPKESEVEEDTVADEESQELNQVEKEDKVAKESGLKRSENSNTFESVMKDHDDTACTSDLNDSSSLSKAAFDERNNVDDEKQKNSGDDEDDIIEVEDDKEEASDSYTENCPATEGSKLCIKYERQSSQNERNDSAEEKKSYKLGANCKVDRANLYLCCNSGCTFLAKDISHLKLHLKSCSFAKDNNKFICPHCDRTYKYLPFLLKHYRVHGKKRIVCMVCNYEAPHTKVAVQHVKSRHHATAATVIPLTDWLEPDDSEVTKDHKLVVVAPKEISLSFLLRKRFLPEDADHLPFPCVYSRDAKCSRCSYSTKIRSNMRRHLHFHLRFNKEGIVPENTSNPNQVPWSASDFVNPMPCLEGKEMMFDKMTNWAMSSHLSDKMKEEEKNSGRKELTVSVYDDEDFIPRFVPENERYVCGVPGCHYQTVDDMMLRHHLRALHCEETTFRCAHCPYDPDFIHQVPVDRLAVHLKMHDDRLYQCIHCNYYHFQRRFVERHLMDKHSDLSQMVNIIREPDTFTKTPGATRTSGMAGTSSDGSVRSSNPSNDAATDESNLWHCSQCSFSCLHREVMSDHIKEAHSLSSQYICGMCPFRSGYLTSFDPHFSSKHPGYPVQLIANYFRSNISEFAPPTIYIILPNGKVIHPLGSQSSHSGDLRNEPVIEVWPFVEKGFGRSSSSAVRLKELNTTYPWHRCMPKIRYIRGIPIADEGEETLFSLSDSLKPKCDDKNSQEEEVDIMTVGGEEKESVVEVVKSPSKIKSDVDDVEQKTINNEVDVDSSVVEKCPEENNKKVEKVKSVETVKESPVKRNLENSERPSPVKKPKLDSPAKKSSIGSVKETNIEVTDPKPAMKVKSPLDLNFDQEGKYVKEESLKEQYGEYGQPEDRYFVCPKCKKYKTKYRGDMKEHLFRELNYKRFVCTHCGLMSPVKARLQKHYQRVHQKDGKPEAIAVLPSDGDIEFWVQHTLNTQLRIMKEVKASGARVEVVEGTSEATPTPNKSTDEDLSKFLYVCKYCCTQFASSRGLKIHIKVTHLKLGGWICGHCDMTANAQMIIIKHCKYTHSDKEPLVLNNTSGSFVDAKFWQENEIVSEVDLSSDSNVVSSSSSKDNQFKCSSCDYKTDQISSLNEHERLQHWSKKPYKCKKCEFVADLESELKKHVCDNDRTALEEKEELLTAKDGEKKTTVKFGLDNEVSNEEIEVMEECESDKDVLIMEANLDEYKDPNPDYTFKCYYCRMKSQSCREVFKHWEEVHHKLASDVGEMRPFKCKKLPLDDKADQKNKKNSSGLYHCAYCQENGSILHLKNHFSLTHLDTDFKIGNVNSITFSCSQCDYSSNTVSVLSRHFESKHPSEKFLYDIKSENSSNIIPKEGSQDSGTDAGEKLQSFDSIEFSAAEKEFLKSSVYRCYWCSEDFVNLALVHTHHNKKHACSPLKYLIEVKTAKTKENSVKSNPQTPANTVKTYYCPSCPFKVQSLPSMFEHLRQHVLPFMCDYCDMRAEVPSKICQHHLKDHTDPNPVIMLHPNAENDIHSLWKKIIVTDEVMIVDESRSRKRCGQSPLSNEPKKHCPVARKSTAQGSAFRSNWKPTARKSTNPSLFMRNLKNTQSSKAGNFSASGDLKTSKEISTDVKVESESESSTNEEFSWYNGGNGAVKDTVDLSKITVWMSFGGCAAKRVPVSKMAQLIDLSPQLCIKDINRFQ